MNVGVVREIKPAERRVALTPSGARAFARAGHHVRVGAGAGVGAGFPDERYRDAGAEIVADAAGLWAWSELLLKVKEPLASEYPLLRPGLVLFAYLHLAADRALTEALIDAGATAVAYETVADDGRLPLLAPMSEIAGRLAASAAAHHLQDPHGGPGLLIGGAPGVAPARVLVVGGGVVGAEAAAVAAGMGAEVVLLERSLERIRALDERFAGRVRVLTSTPESVVEAAAAADVCVGAVLLPGRCAPRLLGRDQLAELRPGAVLVDVAIDQGGCFETSRPTTHDQPTFVERGVLHYCVANMPGAVPVTATRALTQATLPYALELAAANGGLPRRLASGLNVAGGEIVHAGVAEAFPDLPAAVASLA